MDKKTTPINIVNTLPRGYTLFADKDVYRENDYLVHDVDSISHKPKSWIVLSKASFLVRRGMDIKPEVPVYRKRATK